MKTLSSYAIGSKQQLKLIEVGNQKLLLGVSPDNINYLTEIDAAKSSQTQVTQAQPVMNQQLPNAAKTLQSYKKASSKIIESDEKARRVPQKAKSGATKMENPIAENSSNGNPEQKSIEDVTNMIRRKLKNLPNV